MSLAIFCANFLLTVSLIEFILPVYSLHGFDVIVAPEPVLPIPTARQLAWQKRELMMFFHFGMNTFTDKEWGDGTESPAIFNPQALNVTEWISAATAAGCKAVILTAKHHDGFCLWPSKYTNHSVRSSPWKGGHGDIVKEFAKAAALARLELGLYLSPWDRHEPCYGDTPAYNEHYEAQLTEVLSSYGSVAEAWFDGAKGEDADSMEYDFPAWNALVRQLQPLCNIFSGAGPDVRWVGNERAEAGATCWSPLNISNSDPVGLHPEFLKYDRGLIGFRYLNVGDPSGVDWVPPECDVSIRPSWFWHASESPKSVEELVSIYFKSVGRNCVLLLNVPPNADGGIDRADMETLRNFSSKLRDIFETNVAVEAKFLVASSTHGGHLSPFNPAQVLVLGIETFWAAEDGANASSIELQFENQITFNVVQLQEPVSFGQRVSNYSIQAFVHGEWHVLKVGSTIGYKKLDFVGKIVASKVRLVILSGKSSPLIATFHLFFSEWLESLDSFVPHGLDESLLQPNPKEILFI